MQNAEEHGLMRSFQEKDIKIMYVKIAPANPSEKLRTAYVERFYL